MSLDILPDEPQRIAVIGGGISGLAAAYVMAPQNAVTVFEAAPRLGGHARTVMAGKQGDQPVDTGFIVFNYANYPHLTRMFRDLDVPVIKSDMSFGATIDNGRIEYALRSLGSMTAQKRNLVRPGFARMVRDILKFNKHAEAAAADDSLTIGELMDDLRLGAWFQRYYLMPLCGAIWSAAPDQLRAFPARTLVQFFRNHALLGATGQHQWWTVDGGSTEYVKRLEHHLRGRGVALLPGTPVTGVTRDMGRTRGQITVHSARGPQQFDQVVFACHADQALRLLDSPTARERSVLSAIRFQDNEIFLHRDPRQMPKRRSVWSSWVYKADTTRPEPMIGVSYWMNRLQNIPDDDLMIVSLNPSDEVPQEMIYDHNTFRHPVFDLDALRAQRQLNDLQGVQNSWFAGAWTRYGFHEDGFASAVRINRMMAQRQEDRSAMALQGQMI